MPIKIALLIPMLANFLEDPWVVITLHLFPLPIHRLCAKGSKRSLTVCVHCAVLCLTLLDIRSQFLSPPVPMHGGLLCVALRLSVCLTRKKVIRIKVHLKKKITRKKCSRSWVRVKGHLGQCQRSSRLNPA